MWSQGKSMLKYILKRGGHFTDQDPSKMLYLNVPSGEQYISEVDALASSLDIMKQQVEDSIVVYKHAMNRNNHAGHGDASNYVNSNSNGNSAANGGKYYSGGYQNSFDPAVSILSQFVYTYSCSTDAFKYPEIRAQNAVQ